MGLAGVLGTGSVAARDEDTSENDEGLKQQKARFIRDYSWAESQSVSHLEPVRDDARFEEMVATISSDGFVPKTERTMAANLVTERERWNGRDPKLVVLPFDPSPESVSGQGRIDPPQGGGLLLSIVADDRNGERKLASMIGFGTDPSSSVSTATNERSVAVYGNDANTDGSVNAYENNSTSAFSAGRVDVRNVSPVSAAGDMSCDSCLVITNAVCDTAGLGATVATCNKIGVGCLSGGPWTAFGCWAARASLMGTISLFGCYYGSQELCEKAGFC